MLKVWMCVLVALTAATASAQQEWDVGVIGGYGVAHNLTVNNGSGSATTGFSNGSVLGVYGGDDQYRYWSGEASYLYRQSNLKLNGDGQSESFAAHTHLFTGDILAHLRPKESRIRPFVSFGAGLKVIVGTGDEGRPQPLGDTCFTPNPSCFAALTATREVQIVGEVGAGVKIQLAEPLSSAPAGSGLPQPEAARSDRARSRRFDQRNPQRYYRHRFPGLHLVNWRRESDLARLYFEDFLNAEAVLIQAFVPLPADPHPDGWGYDPVA